ncbi:hypothetical protein Aduo_011265 [Ancylostoma duodenale]
MPLLLRRSDVQRRVLFAARLRFRDEVSDKENKKKGTSHISHNMLTYFFIKRASQQIPEPSEEVERHAVRKLSSQNSVVSRPAANNRDRRHPPRRRAYSFLWGYE